MDCDLHFDQHLTAAAHQASLSVSVLCRMAENFNSRGILTLCKAQMRPYMEYSALSWMSSAAIHLQTLDAIQRRALQLVERIAAGRADKSNVTEALAGRVGGGGPTQGLDAGGASSKQTETSTTHCPKGD